MSFVLNFTILYVLLLLLYISLSQLSNLAAWSSIDVASISDSVKSAFLSIPLLVVCVILTILLEYLK